MAMLFSKIQGWFLLSGVDSVKRVAFRFSSELPDFLEPNIIYIIGEKGFYWQLAFLCPCGCKEIIHLNLLTDSSPCWNYIIKHKKISIFPSIYRKKGCMSHFIIRKGKINFLINYIGG